MKSGYMPLPRRVMRGMAAAKSLLRGQARIFVPYYTDPSLNYGPEVRLDALKLAHDLLMSDGDGR